MTQLQGEDPLEQSRIAARHPVQGQQKLLFQHPFAPIHAAGPLDSIGDCCAVHRPAEARLGRVIPPHHHLLLAHEKIGQGVLQLGMHHPHGTGTAAHHAPVLAAQSMQVDLLQQTLQCNRATVRAGFKGLASEATVQQFQNLRLLMQGFRGPQPCPQSVGFCFIKLLFLSCCEIPEIFGIAQQTGVPLRRHVGHVRDGRLFWKLHPTPLNRQFRQLIELHRDAADVAGLQGLPQLQHGLGMVLEGFGTHRNQKQGQPLPTPMTLQKMDLVHEAVHQLTRVIGQVADTFFESCGGEGQPSRSLPVETGGVLGFDAQRRMTAQAKSSVGTDALQSPRQDI